MFRTAVRPTAIAILLSALVAPAAAPAGTGESTPNAVDRALRDVIAGPWRSVDHKARDEGDPILIRLFGAMRVYRH